MKLHLIQTKTDEKSFLKVSKRFIRRKLPKILNRLSEESGQDIHNIYIKEGPDLAQFFTLLDIAKIKVNVKTVNRKDFQIKENYKPNTVNLQFDLGDTFLHNDKNYTVVKRRVGKITIEDNNGEKFNLPVKNPFKWVHSLS